jgi:hypothetical protein
MDPYTLVKFLTWTRTLQVSGGFRVPVRLQGWEARDERGGGQTDACGEE